MVDEVIRIGKGTRAYEVLFIIDELFQALPQNFVIFKYRNFNFQGVFLDNKGKYFFTFYQSPIQVILNFNSIVVPALSKEMILTSPFISSARFRIVFIPFPRYDVAVSNPLPSSRIFIITKLF